MLDYREIISQHDEDLWIIAIPAPMKNSRMGGLASALDGYNNFLISKSTQSKKFLAKKGEKLLFQFGSSMGFKNAIAYGVGNLENLSALEGRQFQQDFSQMGLSIKASTIWVVIPQNAPKAFLEEFPISRTSHKTGPKVTITIG